MTKKEKAHLLKIEAENAMLREANAKHISAYGNIAIEVIELRAKLAAIEAVLQDED